MAISVPHTHTHTHRHTPHTHAHTLSQAAQQFRLWMNSHFVSLSHWDFIPIPLVAHTRRSSLCHCSLSLSPSLSHLFTLSLCALVHGPLSLVVFVWPVSSRCLGYAADEARSLRFVSVWLHKSSNPIDTLRPTAREYKIIKIHFSFVFCFRVFRCIKQPTLEIDLNKFK